MEGCGRGVCLQSLLLSLFFLSVITHSHLYFEAGSIASWLVGSWITDTGYVWDLDMWDFYRASSLSHVCMGWDAS